jgi:hypothetical protein
LPRHHHDADSREDRLPHYQHELVYKPA